VALRIIVLTITASLLIVEGVAVLFFVVPVSSAYLN
jgi:hypothetical protein